MACGKRTSNNIGPMAGHEYMNEEEPGQSVYGYTAKKLDHVPGVRDAWRIDEMLDTFLKKKVLDT